MHFMKFSSTYVLPQGNKVADDELHYHEYVNG